MERWQPNGQDGDGNRGRAALVPVAVPNVGDGVDGAPMRSPTRRCSTCCRIRPSRSRSTATTCSASSTRTAPTGSCSVIPPRTTTSPSATCATSFPPTRSSRTSAPSPAPRANAARSAFEAEWGSSIPTRRVAVDVTPIIGADGVCEQLVGAAYDVSEHRRIEAELAHRTRHDPLTELPNRVMLVEWLQHALVDVRRRRPSRTRDPRHRPLQGRERQPRFRSRRRTARDRGEPLERGSCAPATAWRASAATSSQSCATTSPSVDDVLTLAHRLRAMFDQPFVLGDDEVSLGASVGVVVSEACGRHARRGCCATPTSRSSRRRSSAGVASNCSTTPMRDPRRASARDRELAAPRAGAGRVPRALPARGRVRPLRDDRHRGARALGAPGARAARTGRLPRDRRRDRIDRADRRVGPARSLFADRALVRGAAARSRRCRSRSTSRPRSSSIRSSCRSSTRCSRRRASTRRC